MTAAKLHIILRNEKNIRARLFLQWYINRKYISYTLDISQYTIYYSEISCTGNLKILNNNVCFYFIAVLFFFLFSTQPDNES